MKLPNAKEAIVDLEKLEGYCLNPDHPRGKHKARLFRNILYVGRLDAPELRDRILGAAQTEECERAVSDLYGARYVVDFEWRRGDRTARVRTCWIIRTGESAPRLTSCYVL